MSNTVITIVKHVEFTRVEMKFEVDNHMPIPELMAKIKKEYPGYAITSIEINSKVNHAEPKSRVYSFVVITDGRRLLAKVKHGLLRCIGGGSQGDETTRHSAYRRLNEEVEICDRANWYPVLMPLDSRTAHHKDVQYLESFFLVEVTPYELDCITGKDGRQLQTIPVDMDYLNSLTIDQECDDAYYYAMLRAIQYLS